MGGGYIKPNVSLSRDTKVVHYNYPIWDTNDKPFVDLGLPSGTLWATMNVGAKKPSDAGFYFQWGDTQGYTADQVGTGEGQKKFASDWSDYNLGIIPNFTKYTTTGATLEFEDDAAHIHMGGDWHMPAFEQLEELLNYTTGALATLDGVSGVSFTSKNDTSKSIFFPAAGFALDGSVQFSGDDGSVWSSMTRPDDIASGENLFITQSGPVLHYTHFYRYYGFSVRGVID